MTSTFPNEKAVVSRERAARSYSILEYCLAKVFVEMPLNLLPILVYSVIVHP
ncbi:hypothetical protein EON65_11180 [archaeon]|nr:MAG: hypothetical protein EON65_11180 [archaeon]